MWYSQSQSTISKCYENPLWPNKIQLRAEKVWNRDKIGFNTNGKCHKVVCNYKLFPEERMWKVQTGEKVPLWCTLNVFTWTNGKWFMTTIILRQSKDHSQDLHFTIPLSWIFNHTPYRNMDVYGWLKKITQFSTVWGYSLIKNQILLFNGHGSQFDNRAFSFIEDQNT